ncbi:MAG: 3-dehydroquinate synthase [Clostridia bacterium]|nr:3-dehydroquinate synthase [Clostridia bacterium]
MILNMNLGADSYDIVLERGALGSVGSLLRLDRKALIVTDSGVPAEYAQTVAAACRTPFICTIPEGEASKCFSIYEELLSKLVEYGFTRTDCVVAVGGGVVGDLAGFVASTFMRGIDFYNIPTTVLSQIDSSIGGKVAIDFGGYKNLVGAFYQPKKVVIDPEVLNTLPERHIANGLAEAIKMSLTSDPALFAIFEAGEHMERLDEVIERSLRIKKYVVEQDEKEAGLRKILNFGHTVGHAIESNGQFAELYHGECVALGMLPMVTPDIRQRLLTVLKDVGLPTEHKGDTEALFTAIEHDKKAAAKNITVIYVNTVGTFDMQTIPLTELKARLSDYLN